MSLTKRIMEGPPWLLDDEKVCGNCFGDNGVNSYIENHFDGNSCDFCNSDQIKSLTFSVLMDFIYSKISERYSDLSNACVPYEGGFIFEGHTSNDLLAELKLHINNYAVQEKVESYLDDVNRYEGWIEHEWNMPGDPRYNNEPHFNWKYFCRFVKKNRRFFFSKTKPFHIFSVLEKLIIDNQLIRKLGPGTIFYRARAFKKNALIPECSMATIGPPKSKDIMNKSSRMSPAGIPIFYCSEEKMTAIKEISDLKKEGYALIGKFKLEKTIYIVDFSTVEHVQVPSYFDENISLKERDNIMFLKQFPEEISKKIKKDGREHTEYVPTQIITEFLKSFNIQNKYKIKGVGYKSAIGPGKSYALFFRRGYNDELLPSSFLCLDINSTETVKMPYS